MEFPDHIQSGTRTVVQLAIHFAELKQAALDLLASISGASQRGYFTPSEDDEVRHVLVSYWQSRNALIELVISFRDDAELPQELRPAGFLVAYAGALVLVDAARFLREHFHDRPVARDKLNEPEPHFGIPVGTYDTIQKSLTSPVHLWHLYHAIRYFDEHQSELRGLAGETGLRPLLDIIDRLQEQLQIRLRDYAVLRLRVQARSWMTHADRDLLRRALYGLQKGVSRLMSGMSTAPGHQPLLPEAVRQQLRVLLQPGDVLITRKEHAVTNYFLPGYWPHAAFYLGDVQQLRALGVSEHENAKPRWKRLLECDPDDPRRVLEALKDGVWIRPVSSPLGSDAVAVVRPLISKAHVAEAIARGLFHDGKPYDFDFDFTRSDRLVCTEVVYRSYEGIGDIRFQLTRRAGRMTLAAEDLLRMALGRVHFEPVAAFAPNYARDLLTGTAAEELIAKTAAPAVG